LDHATPLVVGHRLTLHSSILDEDRTILISLPENPQSGGAPMPVIYLLDGGAHFLHTVATMDLLSRRDKMPYSLVVGIENPDRGRDLTAVAVAGRPSGGAGHFLDFIGSELIPFVETSFLTAPHRTLIGHSLGASFVLHALVERPDLFDAAIAISPAITNDERTGEGQASFSKRMGAAFADRESQPFSLFVTMSDGEELEWETDLVAITDLLESDAPGGFEWVYQRMLGEDHGTTVHRSTFIGLRFINRDWAELVDVRTGGLDELRGRFERVSQRLGTEIRPPEVLVNLLGYRLLADGDGEAAIEAFEYNLALYPDSANAHDSLGEALERQGKFPGAMRHYRKAVAKAEADGDPRVAIFRANLARVEALLLEQRSDRHRIGEAEVGHRFDGGDGPRSPR
jgi:enterochelin esterase-like enzyme